MTDQESRVIAAAKAVVAARIARHEMDLSFRPGGVALDPSRKSEWEFLMTEHSMKIVLLDEALRKAVEALPQ
jgi:hypothetical protein